MKKIVSLILVMATMLSLYVPVKAAEKGLGTYRDYEEFEYLLSKDILLGTTNRTFDNFSYSTPEQAVNMCCKEAVGYAAQAFSAKYITGSKPNLSLPVSGPVW